MHRPRNSETQQAYPYGKAGMFEHFGEILKHEFAKLETLIFEKFEIWNFQNLNSDFGIFQCTPSVILLGPSV